MNNSLFFADLPEVVITSKPVIVVELGRMVSIQCIVDSYNGGDTLTWYKIDTDGQLKQGEKHVCQAFEDVPVCKQFNTQYMA